MDKKIIYTDDYDFDEVKRELKEDYYDDEVDYEDIPEPTDKEVFDEINFRKDSDYNYTRDEFDNLEPTKNEIVIIADLGLWNGRFQGANTIGYDLVNVLDGDSCSEDYEWYLEDDDIKCTAYHHDGRNYYLYRELKDEDFKDKVLELAYQGKLTDELIDKYTKPLGKNLFKKLGWE